MMTKKTLLMAIMALWLPPAFADFESPASGQFATPALGSPRPWDLSIRASAGQNDNVQLVPDNTTFPADGRTSANYAALQGEGDYRFYRSPVVVAGVTLSVSSLWYEDARQTQNSKFSDYDFYALSPSVFATYNFALGGLPASLTASYTYAKEDGHNEELEALGLVT